jgi:hypothetical protein
MNILEKTIDPLLIMYIGAMYDVAMTFFGIIFKLGDEANPLINWITPSYLIPVVGLCLFMTGMIVLFGMLKLMEYFINKYNRNVDHHIVWLNRAFIFGGVWHLFTGSTWWLGLI